MTDDPKTWQSPAAARIAELEIELDVLREPVSPSNLRDLGKYLARMLDEDRWPVAERFLNAALSERLALIDERDAAIRRAEAAEEDAERLDWLAANPREATVRVGGDMKIAVFWGVSAAPGTTMRAAIDAARAEPPR